MALRQGGFDYREDAEFEDDIRHVKKKWKEAKKKAFGKKKVSAVKENRLWSKFEKEAMKWLRSRHKSMSRSDIDFFLSGIS